jgi:hypothetical protein
MLHHFFESSAPFSKELFKSDIKFDAVISIAMWMHLERSKYAEVVDNIISAAKTTSTVIISYSEGIRGDDLRYFEDVDLDYITELFYSKDFKLAESVKSGDILNRDNLTWITVVFKHN